MLCTCVNSSIVCTLVCLSVLLLTLFFHISLIIIRESLHHVAELIELDFSITIIVYFGNELFQLRFILI